MSCFRAVHSRTLLTTVVAVLALQCGGGAPVLSTGAARNEVSGLVIKGPVSAGTVTAYRLDAQLRRGTALGSATTDAAGAFTLALPAWSGPLLLVASSGTYVEEAVGVPVKLDGNDLLAVVPDYRPGTALKGLRLTPVSTWAAALAGFHVQKNGAQPGAALEQAFLHLNAHLGDLDWRTVTPADLTAKGTVDVSPEARAGLLLGALSWRARLAAEAAGATPGLAVNAASLSTLLQLDASNGTFDGVAPAGRLSLLRAELSSSTLRQGLAVAMAGFVASDRNQSSLRLEDIKPLQASLAAAQDPWLFCPDQQPSPTCLPGSTDVAPPDVTFVTPVDGAGVTGSVRVEVRAEDASRLKGFTFTAPASLLAVMPGVADGGTAGTLSSALDVSSLADGPLQLSVRAEDVWGLVAARSITVTVANQVPAIAFAAPSNGSTVKDTVVISANATTQHGSIVRLELLNAPPGVGADTQPEAASFAASWDTRRAPEGLTALTIRATNSFGTFADATVQVQVDNVPLGTVHAAVSAGAPIAGATVKLIAIDDTTGLPVVGRAGGAVLGTGGPTAPDGTASFTLTGENWDGPVQLVASGNSLTFIDPSDGATQISIPSTFELTSFIARYRSGDALAAPMTLTTTLADGAALAVMQGKNPVTLGTRPLSVALAVVDPLFSAHISRPVAWKLRDAVPVLLTAGPPQSLRDVVFAAFPDVALNQLARTLSLEGGISPGQVVTAITLSQLLSQDLSDGQFDGKQGGAPLQTAGAPPYLLDANTTRFKLAIELDRFIRGPQNFSGLTRLDLQHASVLDNISGDTSLLYPSSPAPLAFDNQPPAVTFTATFQAADGTTGNPPVGAARIVGGAVTVTADATDPSGMQSLDVRVGGAPLTVVQGNTASHFVGTWRTTADGPLTFRATAHDKVGNSGTTDFVVTVDNTRPTVTALQPLAAFYSQALPVEATATDASGLASFAPIGLPGFVDQDAAVGRVFGSWSLPPALTDGPFPVRFHVCDAVKNCEVLTTNPVIDRTPPVLTLWGNAPPQFTNATSLSLSFDATDGAGAGVAAVRLRLGTMSFSATQSGGRWLFSNIPLPATGSATVVVWAEDSATPANSGQSAGAPFERSYTLRIDRTPPAAVPAPLPSYFDERTMDFVRHANGDPQVPVVYSFPTSQQPVTVTPGMTIYKAGTRLSAADGNVPTLHYQVPFDAAQDAPVTAVLRWSTPHCYPAGCVVEFPLLSDASRVVPGNVFFKLELHRESLQGRSGLQNLAVAFRDAAGNETVRSDAITLNVVRPPMAVKEDSAWTLAADPRSVFPYRIQLQTYGSLFGASSPAASHGSARMVRYVVKNPAPYEVAVNFELLAGAQSIKESWGNQRVDLYERDGDGSLGGGSYLLDGLTFGRSRFWDANDPTQCTDGTSPAPECSPTAINAGYFPLHSNGSSTPYECGVPSMLNASDVVYPTLTGGVGVHAFSNPLPSGNELVEAVPYLDPSAGATRGAIIPAASANAPGAVVFYLEVALPSTRADPVLWQALPEDPTLKYQYSRGDVFLPHSQGYSCASGVYTTFFHAWRWTRSLTSATSNVNGLFTVRTGAPLVMDASGLQRPQFGMGTVGSPINFNRTFNH